MGIKAGGAGALGGGTCALGLVLDLEQLDVVRLSCLSSSAPTGTTGWIVDGRRGTETVPGTAAGAATGIAEVVCDVSASLAAGFAGAFGGRGGVGSTLPATK